jgi:hypothetical protein
MRPWQISLQDYIEDHFPDFILKPEMKYTRVKRVTATRIQALKSLTKDGEMGRLKKKQA